jgi:hypothetical protein
LKRMDMFRQTISCQMGVSMRPLGRGDAGVADAYAYVEADCFRYLS